MDGPADPAAITGRIAGFVSHLREAGFPLGPGAFLDALTVISRTPVSISAVRTRLKVLLVSSHDEWRRFDTLFDEFWFPAPEARPLSDFELAASVIRAPSSAFKGFTKLEEGARPSRTAPGATDRGEESDDASGADIEALSHTDLAELADPAENAEAERLAFRLASAIRRRLQRRARAARRSARLDLRRTIRASLAHGGEVVEVKFRKRPKRPVRIVMLVDVSGSMKPYARAFLQFARGLVVTWSRAEVWLMHTKLVAASRALRDRDPAAAMARLSQTAAGFGGGTRLGSCLRAFNEGTGRRSLDRRTVVVILSDGYDSGSEDLFAAEIDRIRRRARRLVWLNPLAHRAGYRPITLAMLSALPHIDRFAAGATLASLAEIESDFARL